MNQSEAKQKLDQLRQSETLKTSKKNLGLDKSLLSQIWFAMAGMYGEKWKNQFGDWGHENPCVQIWAAALKGLSDVDIKTGLNAVAMAGSPFVPTAPEFRKFCLGDDEHWEHKRMRIESQETNEVLRLQKLQSRNPEIGMKHLDELRKKLGMAVTV